MLIETANLKDTLILLLSRVRRRMRFSMFYSNFTFYLLWAILLSGVILFASKFVLLQLPIYLLATVCLFVALVISLARTFWQRLTLCDVAGALDVNFDLKERFSTALELIDKGYTDGIAFLQVADAAEFAKSLNPKSAHPYSLPKSAKFIPVVLLFVVASFMMPRFYELPPQPTDAERMAMRDAASELEDISKSLSGKTAKDLSKTINTLRREEDVRKAQKQLASLRGALSTRRDELEKPDLPETLEAIERAMQNSKLFPDSTPDALAKELDKLAEDNQIPPEVKKELENLLAQLNGLIAPKELVEELKSRFASPLRSERKIESEQLSPEMLNQVAQHLKKLAERARKVKSIEEMLAQIGESQEKIGLAGLDLKKNSGVARGDSSPGEGTGETQDRRVDADVTKNKEGSATLELTGNPQSPDGKLSTTHTRESPDEVGQTNVPYQQAYLSAKQSLGEALEKNRIPARYRNQVERYFKAIAPE